jgi:hypothetical protein
MEKHQLRAEEEEDAIDDKWGTVGKGMLGEVGTGSWRETVVASMPLRRDLEASMAQQHGGEKSFGASVLSHKSTRRKKDLKENEILDIVRTFDEKENETLWFWSYKSMLERERKEAAVWTFRFSLVVVALVAVENEMNFYDFQSKTAALNLIKCIMFALSMMSVSLNYRYHRRHWSLGQLSRLEPIKANFVYSRRFYLFLAEAGYLMLLVPPFLNFNLHVKREGSLATPGEATEYVFSGIVLDWFAAFRLFLVIRSVTTTSKFQSGSARILGSIGKINFDQSFGIGFTT